MDNAAFRTLLSSPDNGINANSNRPPTNLGSRARPLPMTPRNISSHNKKGAVSSAFGSEPPSKRFKSSAAPKGTRLGAGYVDRARLRQKQEDSTVDEDLGLRLINLEEQFKLGQIDQVQFQKLKDQIGVGGNVGSTHLVKGLDWKLLERVRQGEDVSQTAAPEIDVDRELEDALEKEVVRASKMENPESDVETDGRQNGPMKRDEILRQFRERRTLPQVDPVIPSLNEKFKRVAASEKPGKKKHIESVNGRRREVLIITNTDGTTKRKTRWIDPEDVKMPVQQPLGMEVPAEIAARQKALLEAEANENHNEDIFADAGVDYNPLAGLQEDASDEDGEAQEGQAKPDVSTNAMHRNYFSTDTASNAPDTTPDPMTIDTTMLAALRRAAQIQQREEVTNNSESSQAATGTGAKSSAFLAKLKERERQDEADLDYGFGESRFGGDDDDDDDAGPSYDGKNEENEKGGRRKRGSKKRKGNKENLQDVMNVLGGNRKS